MIHHSDAGSQYTALAFTEELAEAGIAGSIGTVGDALDNALMESTIGLYKTELILPYSRTRNWSGVRDVERETAEWVRWYNNERIHSSIDYMTPIRWEVMYSDTIAQRGRGGLNPGLSRTQDGSTVPTATSGPTCPGARRARSWAMPRRAPAGGVALRSRQARSGEW